MTNIFDQLVAVLNTSSLSTAILHQITGLFKQQTDESLPKFVLQSCQSLLALNQWAWQLFSQDSNQWINQPYYLELLHTIALINKKVIFNNNKIDISIKLTLLFCVSVDQINKIFQQIEQCNDDYNPLITIVSLWLDNQSHFLYDNPEYGTSFVIDHIGQYIVHKYLMSKQYKLYLTQLRQPDLMQSVFTPKMLFYIQTCSFYTYSYLLSNVNNFPYTADEMIDYLSEDYLEIVHVHSYTVASWNKELLSCVAQLVGLVTGCCWWDGQKRTQMKKLFPTEQITCDQVQDLIRIIAHQPFCKQTKSQRLNDETILMDSSLMVLIITTHTQNINWLFRSNVAIRDTVVSVAQAALNDKVCLRAYGILGEALTDNELKYLKIADNISDYFFTVLGEAWNHSSKIYKQVPLVYLLRGMSRA